MAEISLCMIVRDERETLARCLDSVKEAVDEIIIVDTGSKEAGVSSCGVGAFDVFPAVWPCEGSAAHPESNAASRSAHNIRSFFMG